MHSSKNLISARFKDSPVHSHLTEGDVLLTRLEAAQFLRSSVSTLERWARLGTGPVFRLVGRKALYSLTDLRRFADVQVDD